jgi:molybdenum cofactor cytidylyltransferase
VSTLSVSAILLSAGESTRMGQPKATLPWLGMQLIQYQISSLIDAGCAPVVVVLGHRPELQQPFIPKVDLLKVIVNSSYQDGKTTSIKAGLRLAGNDSCGVMVLAVDQPRSAELLKLLVGAHLAKRALITAPFYQGKFGHPVIFSRTLFPELREITEETMGLRMLMERYSGQLNQVTVDNPVIHLDMNGQEDYLRALASAEATK